MNDLKKIRLDLIIEMDSVNQIKIKIDECIKEKIKNSQYIKVEDNNFTLIKEFFGKEHKIPNVCRFILKKSGSKYKVQCHKNTDKIFKNSK